MAEIESQEEYYYSYDEWWELLAPHQQLLFFTSAWTNGNKKTKNLPKIHIKKFFEVKHYHD
jgi:hypothetical protein